VPMFDAVEAAEVTDTNGRPFRTGRMIVLNGGGGI
jgi:F420-0:gamma-glutamyl ligase